MNRMNVSRMRAPRFHQTDRNKRTPFFSSSSSNSDLKMPRRSPLDLVLFGLSMSVASEHQRRGKSVAQNRIIVCAVLFPLVAVAPVQNKSL